MKYYKITNVSGDEFYCPEGTRIDILKAQEVSVVEHVDMTDKEYNALSTGNHAAELFK